MCQSNVCAGGLPTCQPANCGNKPNTANPRIAAGEAPIRVVRHVPSPTEIRYELWTLREDASSLEYKRTSFGPVKKLILEKAKRYAANPDYADVAIEAWSVATNTYLSSETILA